MLQKILPREIVSTSADLLNMDKLYEVRLRSGGVVGINYGGRFYFLSKNGLVDKPNLAIQCTQAMLQDVVMRASDYSIYASTKQINNGYISVQGGIRIGICGEVVWDNNSIKAVKNFSAINIRVPHQVHGCADFGMKYITSSIAVSDLKTNNSDKNGVSSDQISIKKDDVLDTKSSTHSNNYNNISTKSTTQIASKNSKDTYVNILNTLILSPPGAGKTTYLRDIARQLGNMSPILNTLLVDERSELAACYNGVPQLDVGYTTDIISNCSKNFAFEQGIRAMRPDVIITDELAGTQDLQSITYAMSAGVKTIASIHAYDMRDLHQKLGFKNLLNSKIFELYIVLSSTPKVGTVVEIYDKNMQLIYEKNSQFSILNSQLL